MSRFSKPLLAEFGIHHRLTSCVCFSTTSIDVSRSRTKWNTGVQIHFFKFAFWMKKKNRFLAGPGQEDDEAADGGVFEVCHLKLTGSELHPPSNLGVRWGRFKPHRLPTGHCHWLNRPLLSRVVTYKESCSSRSWQSLEIKSWLFYSFIFMPLPPIVKVP